MIRVLIVDDHPVLRTGIAALIEDEDDLTVVGEAGDGATAIAMFRTLLPDVTIMDLQLPDGNGEDFLEALIDERPGARFVALSTFGGEDTIRRAIEAGAIGYVLKDAARGEVVTAIRHAAAGRQFVRGVVEEKLRDALAQDRLTSREDDVLRELALGHSNQAIARRLDIAEATVKVHIGHIIQKLHATDRTDAVLKALARGTIRLR